MKLFAKCHWGQVALSAVAFSTFYTLVLPLQTYLANSGMFAYGIMDLLPELLMYFAMFLAGSLLISVITTPVLGRLLPLLFVIAAICGYLEVGILSMGLPPLNGETWWFNRSTIRRYLDVAVFVSLALGGLVFCKKFFCVLHWIALGFLVMCVAFVFDVGGGGTAQTENKPTAFVKGFCPLNDMVRSVAFSTNRNVLVICLDSTPASLANEIMEENKQLREHFPGFVGYSENIGMHDCTTKGVPALVTGRYCEKDDLEHENNMSFWGDKSILNGYHSSGYEMYVRMAVGACYTNRRKVYSPKASLPMRKNVMDRYSTSTPYLTLKDVVRFRLTLFRYKLCVLKEMMSSGIRLAVKSDADMGREWNLYPILEKAPMAKDGDAKCFCLFHTEGVHVPIIRDRLGNPLSQSSETREAIKNCLHYLLEMVGGVMDSLRARGIYDNTMVVLTTDHGIVKDPKSALLWVKPFRDKRSYSVSRAPTSHAKIASLLALATDSDLSADEITKALSMKERKLRIRYFSPEKWWQFGRLVDTYDFLYDENGNEISRTCLGEFVLP